MAGRAFFKVLIKLFSIKVYKATKNFNHYQHFYVPNCAFYPLSSKTGEVGQLHRAKVIQIITEMRFKSHS